MRTEAGPGGFPSRSASFSHVSRRDDLPPIGNPYLQARSPDPCLDARGSTAVIPRAPVVHLFVCDNGNTKVKALADQFVTLLTSNGIKVFAERFVTHQPGYQVSAASQNTNADFFFQIHSKTAGPGHVRLYRDGLPNRMTAEEAVAYVWSWWKVRCGALAHHEVEVAGCDKVNFLLKEFCNLGDAEKTFAGILKSVRDREPLVFERIRDFERMLEEGRSRVVHARAVASEWPREPGEQLARCVAHALFVDCLHR